MHIIVVLRTLLFCLLVPAAAALAQDLPAAATVTPQQNPFTTHSKFIYGGAKMILLRSAEKMPEESYAFKPTDSVRNFGQIVGHVADAQYTFCSAAIGAKDPAPNIEETKTSKADLVAALKAAFAYCDKAYEGMTDDSGAQMVKLMRTDMPKLGVLTVNQVHMIEHYGNLVTYMRIKNIVPPTSEPEFMKQMGR